MSTHEDLTPEERALAQRLARIGPQGEPSSTLDARILAAAHAAAAPEPIRPRRAEKRKAARWPTVFGVAASLALACGIAWQLRPLPQATVSAESTGRGDDALAVYKAPAPSMSVRVVPPKPLMVPAPPPAEPERRQPRRAAIRDATPADAQAKPQAFDAPAPFVLDEALPAHSHAAQTAAPAAAPPPPPQAMAQEAAAAADTTAAAAPAPSSLQRAAPAPVAAKAAANAAQREADSAERRREAATGVMAEPEYAEPDEEVVPPATADRPEVRDAWLRRIRELVRAGKTDQARQSLHAFRERYPHQAVPEDLRALGE